jgi:hypothetical protein
MLAAIELITSCFVVCYIKRKRFHKYVQFSAVCKWHSVHDPHPPHLLPYILHLLAFTVFTSVAWQRLSTADIPLLPGSRPRRPVTISSPPLTAGLIWCFPSDFSSRAELTNCRLSTNTFAPTQLTPITRLTEHRYILRKA